MLDCAVFGVIAAVCLGLSQADAQVVTSFVCLPSLAQFVGLADSLGIYFWFILGLRCACLRWSHSFWEKSSQSLFISCCTEFHSRFCPVPVIKTTSPHTPSALG